jgi:hypothetical protein
MNVDHFYTIGDSHQECQDYAISKIFDNGVAFACVADGCSGSHDMCRSVDVGARILALSAEMVIKTMTQDMDDPIGFLYHEFYVLKRQKRLGDKILATAIDIANPLLLNGILREESFDSTLVFSIAKDNKALIYCFGDGVAVVKNSIVSSVYEVRFSSGAPYYLSYKMDNQRNAIYHGVKNNTMFVTTDIQGENSHTNNIEPVRLNDWENVSPYEFSSLYIDDTMGFDTISVMSDGVGSFEEEGKPKDVIEMTREATAFKNYNGVFVQRRMKKFLKVAERSGISHYDDFSIATIHNDSQVT